MPKIANGFVNELKSRVDIYDVVNPYVQLKKSGSSWVGLSPFSQEKTPSFYVHPDKGFFKCFSSGEGGDIISFIQKVEHLEFQEALEFLAERFNITIRYADTGNSSAPTISKSLRSELFEIHQVAEKWFQQNLTQDHKEAKEALKYWTEDRGFSLETAKEFGIGYAPTDRFSLGNYLEKQGYSPSTLLKSGLFREGKNGKIGAAIFTGRLIIPICDKIGRTCAFTARKLSFTPEWGDRKSPKYINSPETPIFEKGKLLFNLHLANKEIDESKEFLLVEGQLDAIRCWTEGFPTTIAPQGTAFKEEQARLLSRSRPRGVVCLLDGDEAGQKAAVSYVSTFLKSGIEARFAQLPPGSDPDQILVGKGSTALQDIIDHALPMIEFVIRQKLPDSGISSPKQKESICNWIFEPLAEVESHIAKEGYLEQISRLLNIPIDTLKLDFARFRKNRKPAYLGPISASEENTSGKPSDRLTIVEDDLLLVVLHDDRIASPLAQVLDLSWVDLCSTSGRILAKILAETLADGPLDQSQIEDILEGDEERDHYHRLLLQEFTTKDPDIGIRLGQQCLRVLFLRHTKKEEDRILALIKKSITNEDDNLSSLSDELRNIRSIRNNDPILKI